MDQRGLIDDISAFLAVARARSFTRAASQLGISQSRLSQTVRALEERLGVRLLARTTRSVAPTEAGEHLLRNVAPHFEQIEAELGVLTDFGAKPAGTVRLTATENAAAAVLWPAFRGIVDDYPGIHLEVSIDNGPTDIVAEGYDAGVRHGDMIAKGMIAVAVGPELRMAVVGTPEYLARHGRPSTPHDLTDHTCINLRFTPDSGVYPWEFEKKGRELRVRVDGPLIVTTAPASLTAALAGLGLAYLPEDMAAGPLASGTLQRVLQDWCEPFPGYHLYFPNRRQHSAAFAVLIERLRYRLPLGRKNDRISR
jgi:DNA-binding transcriptional LysR family regulator